jgi:hypothetical protein
MEKVYEITRAQLVEGFKKWNVEFVEHPELFYDVNEVPYDEEKQADSLMEYMGIEIVLMGKPVDS